MNNLRRRKTEKKTPIKGEPKDKPIVVKEIKKEIKEIPCSQCGKSRPLANKSKKICGVCVKKNAVEKAKKRRQVKKERRANTITQAKLDQITSWLIRAAFEEKCHACETPMSRKQLQCCHFVSRTKNITRFDLRNMLPGCPTCNMYTPHHVWNLGKSINKIWGENLTETLLDISTISLKMNNSDRKEIYDIYKDALDKIESQDLSYEQRYLIIVNCYYEYHKVISKLVKL